MLNRTLASAVAYMAMVGCHKALPENYAIFQYSLNEVVIDKPVSNEGDPYIPAKVVKVWWDSRFIAAATHPMVRRNPSSDNDRTLIPDESRTQYWIIDTLHDKLYGPCADHELDKLENDLEIRHRIVFQNIPWTMIN